MTPSPRLRLSRLSRELKLIMMNELTKDRVLLTQFLVIQDKESEFFILNIISYIRYTFVRACACA